MRTTGQTCSGRGVCRSTGSPGHSPDRCVCHVGFEGEGCELDAEGTLGCVRGCSGHGKCSHNRCTCDLGYAGRDCSILLRYSSLAHVMESSSNKLMACVTLLAVTSFCATLAARYIEVGVTPKAIQMKPVR